MNKEERRIYDRAYYAKNKEKNREKRLIRSQKWHNEHKDYNREYYKKTYTKVEKKKKGFLQAEIGEIWVDIEGTDGWYMVSNHKRVWSWKRGKFIKPSLHKNKYYLVFLNKKSYWLHRIIATAFVPNPDNLPEVDHINTITTDNRPENLRWVDRKGNQNNDITIQKFRATGQRNFYTKGYEGEKPVVQYNMDGEELCVYKSIKDAARKTNVSRTGIGNTCNHRQHSAGGYKWEFVS